jgi:hypothetical protein
MVYLIHLELNKKGRAIADPSVFYYLDLHNYLVTS